MIAARGAARSSARRFLQAGIKALAATVKEQASHIQKVSAQLELSKPAPINVTRNRYV
jgi:hypothetical protein